MSISETSFSVIKANGDEEPFSTNKVLFALRRIGLSSQDSNQMLAKLLPKLYAGITTREIYSILRQIIRQSRPEASHKYNLKNALLALGPEGYVFEDFIARLLSLQGYSCQLRQKVNGKCVTHEIDVVATILNKSFMIECKFHNEYGQKCRIQTALYVYARFLDLAASSKFSQPWLITNTKFSEDVMRYAQCMGFPLLGWRYPLNKSLESKIERVKCYPVSVIQMPMIILKQLLKSKIITVFDLPESSQKLAAMLTISSAKAENIIEQAKYIR